MTTIPDDPERIERDTDAALDRHREAMTNLARSRAGRGRTLSPDLEAHLPASSTQPEQEA